MSDRGGGGVLRRLGRWLAGDAPRPVGVRGGGRQPRPAGDGGGPAILPGAYSAVGYNSAAAIRESGRPAPQGGTADRHLRVDRSVLVREGLRLDRDSALYKSLLERSLDAILGRDGFSLQFRTPDEALNADLEARWRSWSRAPEVRQLFGWKDCERLALRSVLNAGDIGVIRTTDKRIKYVESEQITHASGDTVSTPVGTDGHRIEQGVELDANDAPVAYHVARYDTHGYIQRGTVQRISADDMTLVAYRERFSQTRGVPALSHVMPLVHRLNDVLDSEAIAWQQLARFSVAFNFAGAPGAALDLTSAADPTRDQPPSLDNRYLEHQAGTFFFGEPGEAVTGIKRELPGANFPASVQTFLRLLGMAFGLPYSVLSLDYSQTTYTSSRAELEQAFRMFIRRQRDLIRGHHDPITRWWLEWLLEEGEIGQRQIEDLPFAWIAPEFPWIDQLSEAEAWGVRIDRGFATQTEALASLGIQHEDYVAKRTAELVRARRAAREIEEAEPHGGPVDWRYLGGLMVSKQQSAAETEAEMRGAAV